MFRASSCPSSGATTPAVAASGLPSELGDSSTVGRGRSGQLARPRPTALLSPSSDGKPEALTVVVVAPDDGHEDARNMLSCIWTTSNKLEKLLRLVGWFSWKYDDARTGKPKLAEIFFFPSPPQDKISNPYSLLFHEYRRVCTWAKAAGVWSWLFTSTL